MDFAGCQVVCGVSRRAISTTLTYERCRIEPIDLTPNAKNSSVVDLYGKNNTIFYVPCLQALSQFSQFNFLYSSIKYAIWSSRVRFTPDSSTA